MSKRNTNSQPKCKRRAHSEKFKREAVKCVFDQQLSVAEAARKLVSRDEQPRNKQSRTRILLVGRVE